MQVRHGYAKKRTKASFLTPWGEDEHVSDFFIRLDQDQAELRKIGIAINDVNDKFQFYIEQMYTLGRYKKVQMIAWEAKGDANKTYINACAYFELVAEQNETHLKNNDGTTARNGFGTLNNTVEIGDEIRGALETVCTNRDEAHAKERDEHLLQMWNSEARHESNMAKMTASFKAVTEALLTMKLQLPATPVPVAQPIPAPNRQTDAALQTMAVSIAALAARMQVPGAAAANATTPATPGVTTRIAPSLEVLTAREARAALKISDPVKWQRDIDAFYANPARIAMKVKLNARRARAGKMPRR